MPVVWLRRFLGSTTVGDDTSDKDCDAVVVRECDVVGVVLQLKLKVDEFRSGVDVPVKAAEGDRLTLSVCSVVEVGLGEEDAVSDPLVAVLDHSDALRVMECVMEPASVGEKDPDPLADEEREAVILF